MDCAFCRCDDSGTVYVCRRPAVVMWHHEQYQPVPVCDECREWLDILISLGQL